MVVCAVHRISRSFVGVSNIYAAPCRPRRGQTPGPQRLRELLFWTMEASRYSKVARTIGRNLRALKQMDSHGEVREGRADHESSHDPTASESLVGMFDAFPRN